MRKVIPGSIRRGDCICSRVMRKRKDLAGKNHSLPENSAASATVCPPRVVYGGPWAPHDWGFSTAC